MRFSRRHFSGKLLKLAGGAAALPSLLKSADGLKDFSHIHHPDPHKAARDEDFWFRVQQAFTTSPNVIYLNNGNVSPQPRVVQEAAQRYVELSNEGPGYYMRRIVGKGKEMVRRKLADMAGCSPEEIALHRNATESLETVIFGLDLKKGDEIIMADQDYPAMRAAFQQREKREGIVIREVELPIDYTDDQEVIDLYTKAMSPRTRVVLITHMIHYTGQVLPVKAIAEIAQSKGIEVIVDAAHSFAHIDHKIADLHCDYYGVSLHKWLCAPFGTGMLYVKKEKIKKLWPLFGAGNNSREDDIRKFEHLGTYSSPNEMAIGHAIDFHQGIGIQRKEARLQYLKNYWAEKALELPGVSFNIPLEKSCGIAHVQFRDHDPLKVYSTLFSRYNIYTMRYQLEGKLDGIRVSPHIYTRPKDLDFFIAALKEILEA